MLNLTEDRYNILSGLYCFTHTHTHTLTYTHVLTHTHSHTYIHIHTRTHTHFTSFSLSSSQIRRVKDADDIPMICEYCTNHCCVMVITIPAYHLQWLVTRLICQEEKLTTKWHKRTPKITAWVTWRHRPRQDTAW